MSSILHTPSASKVLTVTPPGGSPDSGRQGSAFYLPELDVLRFVAFLGVFFYHLRSPGLDAALTRISAKLPATGFLVRVCNDAFAAGGFGVDLFFVLSAYLITELLIREKTLRGVLDVRAFYTRRILRIWPLYFFFLLLAWVLQLFVPHQVFSWQYAVAFLVLSGNWICALHGLPASVALPLWSVSVEEQFYLLWPQLVRRASVERMKLAAAVLLVIATGMRVYLTATHASAAMLSYSTFTRCDGIAIGILTSLFLRGRIPSVAVVTRLLTGIAGIAGLLVGADLLIRTGPNSPPSMLAGILAFPIVGVAGMLLLISFLGSGLGDWRIVRWFRLVYLGKISYGLYVYHYLALLLARAIIGPLRPAVYLLYAFLGLALTIAMAAVSYRVLERPFLVLKKRFSYVDSRPE